MNARRVVDDHAAAGARMGFTNQGDVETQIGVVHGDAIIYKVNKEDPPERKFEVGVNYLKAGVISRAEELICEAVMHGFVSGKVAYHWMLAILSGRSFEHLTPEDLSKLERARDMSRNSAAGDWDAALEVITSLLECLATQEIDSSGEPDPIELTAVIDAYALLPDERRIEIARHLDMILGGTLQDRVDRIEAETARRLRVDGGREWRVPLFFEAKPTRPLPIPYQPQSAGTYAWAGVVGGLLLCGIGLPLAVPIMFREGASLGWLSAALEVCGWVLIASSMPVLEWLKQPAVDRSKRGQWSPPSRREGTTFYEDLKTLIRRAFDNEAPADSARKSLWENASRDLRVTLAQELYDTYSSASIPAPRLAWLIRHRARLAAQRWRSTGSVEQSLARPSKDLWSRSIIGAFAALAGVTIIPVTLHSSGNAVRLGLTALLWAGAVPAALGAMAMLLSRHRNLSQLRLRHLRYGNEVEAFHRWTAYLAANRPNDEEMGQWLDHDMRHMKASAMARYSLTSRGIIAHIILTEPHPGCDRARYVYGPPRYSRYKVTVFLLTGDGVRQLTTAIDFATAMEINEHRQSFRYDAIAIARVVEFGARFQLNAPKGHGHNNGHEVHGLLFGRELKITLTGGKDDAVSIWIENFARGLSDRREKNSALLYRLAVDSSGVATALRILEAVAADGKEWIKLDKLKREHYAKMYKMKLESTN
jgi:hypothetical protein